MRHKRKIYNSRNSKDLIVSREAHGAVSIYNSRNSKDLIVPFACKVNQRYLKSTLCNLFSFIKIPPFQTSIKRARRQRIKKQQFNKFDLPIYRLRFATST